MMDSKLRSKLLAYLGGAAIALSSGSVDISRAELSDVPEGIMEELIGEVDGEDWKAEDLTSLTVLLADDPRKEVRRRAACLFTGSKEAISDASLEPVLLKLARDQDPLVRDALAESLATWLGRISAFQCARVVCEWSVAEEAAVRLTLAQALAQARTTGALAEDLAIEQLAGDADEAVRIAAVEAAAAHFGENPALYSSILRRLAFDESAAVACSVGQAMERLTELA